MKTTLTLFALGGLILVASCFQHALGAQNTDRIDVSLTINTNSNSWQAVWTFQNGANGAWTQKIKKKDMMEWHFPHYFFLFINEKKAPVAWDQCTDPAGRSLPWITNNLQPPFKEPFHRALNATNESNGDWVVRLVLPANQVDMSLVHYRLVTCLEDHPILKKGRIHLLALSYDYYMAEALLDWGNGLRGAHH